MLLDAQPTPNIIFELPPILDAICNQLGVEEIQRCRLVCKIWSTLFESYRWKYINLDSLKRPSANLLARNSHWILRLHASLRIFLDTDQSSFTNLRELTLYDYGSMRLSEREFRPDQPELEQGLIVDLGAQNSAACVFPTCPLTAITKLVNLNPRLHTLRMHAIQSRLQPFDYGLLARFGTHPTLTHLTLAAVEKPTQDDIFLMLAILKNCPSSLRSLCLRCDYSSKDFHDRLAELHAAILERKHPWRVFESLEHLEISWDPEGCQSWVHLPILRNSPKLTRLFIGSDKPAVIVADFHIGDMQKVLQATRIFCPNIRHLGGRFAGYPDLENDLVRLIQAYPKGLKSLDVVLNMSVQNLFIPALLPISTTTLECLRLGALQMEVESADIIVHVLKECPNLRELSFSIGLSLDELLQNPWASHHLEILHIELWKPDYYWTPWLGNDLIDDDQYPKLATEILELYRKVKAHSKAGFSARFPCVGYRMPHDVAMELIGHEITEQQLLSMDLGWPSTKDQCDP